MNHILFIPGWYKNLTGKGGGSFFREQAYILRERGWDARLLYADLRPYYWPNPKIRVDDDERLPVLRYQNWSPPKIGTNSISYWQRRYLQAFNIYINEWGIPQIIHAHSYLGALAAAFIKQEFGIPYIVTEHLSRLTRKDIYLSSRIQLAVRMAYSEASGLYAVSRVLAKAMDQYNPSGLPIGVIPNTVDTDFFTPADPAIKAENDLVICSIGDPWHMKGLDLLIQAVGKAQQQTNRRIRLRLADKIPGRKKLYSFIQQYGLRDQVEFVGRLSRAEVRDLLRNSDICVSASRYESFGITMIEALACGTPVIATRTAGGQDIIQDGVNGYLVDVNSVGQLADAILGMSSVKNNFPIDQLRDPVVDRYSHTAVAQRIEAAYFEVLPELNVNRES